MKFWRRKKSLTVQLSLVNEAVEAAVRVAVKRELERQLSPQLRGGRCRMDVGHIHAEPLNLLDVTVEGRRVEMAEYVKGWNPYGAGNKP